MRVAIIGGRGFIGGALANELRSSGHTPLILSRHARIGETLDGIEVIQWDGRDANRLSSVINDADALVNLAGESIGASRWTKNRLDEIYSSRLVPGKAIVDAWSKMSHPPAVLIQASAVGFYGSTDSPTDEVAPQGRDPLAKLCQEWEASTMPVSSMGTRHVIVRSGVVFDKRQGILPQMALPFKLFVGGPVGTGDQWISWIHIQDEARAIRWLLENPALSGVFNLAAPHPVTNAEFGRTLAKIIHRLYWFRVPASILRIVLGTMSSLILEGQKVVPFRLAESGFEFRYPSLVSALSDLYRIH